MKKNWNINDLLTLIVEKVENISRSPISHPIFKSAIK